MSLYDARFKVASSWIISGASASGKSYFVKQLVANRELLFDQKFEKVIWTYNYFQDMFNDPSLKDVVFVQGLSLSDYSKDEGHRLLVVDDNMENIGDCKEFSRLFTQNRHIKITTIFITQNLFFKSPVYRCASLNANYFVVMRALRDKRQTMTLVQQMFPENIKYAKEAVMDATRDPYSYVILDTRQATPDELRIRSNIFPIEGSEGCYTQTVYVPTHRGF